MFIVGLSLNEWVLNKEGTVRHRQSKEASILWSHHEETSLEKEILQRTGEEGHARPGWTTSRLSMEESIRMTKDRDKNVESTSMVWPTLGSRTAKDQIR